MTPMARPWVLSMSSNEKNMPELFHFMLTFVLQEGRKKFEKQTAKFCQSQERYLNLSTKKQDSVLQEVIFTCLIKAYVI